MKAAGSVTLTDPMCSRDPFVENIARQIVREMSYPDAYSAMTIDLLAQHLVVRLIREHSSLSGSITRTERSVAGYRDWRLKRLVEYLEAHVSDDVGLNDLAELVGLSAARVATLFREGTGEPPHRWLMNRRVTKACELLGNPSLSIGEIAQQCGFASPQHLATVMRRLLATTPTEFRAASLELTLSESKGNAVVLGAGIAGLLAARVLADFYGDVTVVERDSLPNGPRNRRECPRAGCPTSRRHAPHKAWKSCSLASLPTLSPAVRGCGTTVICRDSA